MQIDYSGVRQEGWFYDGGTQYPAVLELDGRTFYQSRSYKAPGVAEKILELALARPEVTRGFLGEPYAGLASLEFKKTNGQRGVWVHGPDLDAGRVIAIMQEELEPACCVQMNMERVF